MQHNICCAAQWGRIPGKRFKGLKTSELCFFAFLSNMQKKVMYKQDCIFAKPHSILQL